MRLAGDMTAVWMWARADLRARWRSWVVLGVLAGATFGLAAAGIAGARRTERALPRALAASPRLDAAVLPNDPEFDAEKRAAVAALPEVQGAYPFIVPFFLGFSKPSGVDGQLIPTTARSARALSGILIEGRLPNPKRMEIVIDENIRDRHDVDIGSTMVLEQHVPPEARGETVIGTIPDDVDLDLRARFTVVGIAKATSTGDESAAVSAAFAKRYGDRILGPTNMFVTLRGGETRFPAFQRHVQEIMGRPINVEPGSDFLRLRQTANVADIERDGLLLFAFAALVVGGVLVGQALVRAVTAGAADATTWRALGADRALLVRAMVLPASIAAAVGSVVSIVVAVLLSPRFPLGSIRRIELDIGFHADWPVLIAFALGVAVAVGAVAAATAWWRTGRAESAQLQPSAVGDWAARVGMSPALVIGARLAVEPGRGRRAVPVRSALVGAVVGVLGVVACFTFRSGIDDALRTPQRSGVVWDSFYVNIGGPIPPDTMAEIVRTPGAEAVLDARWVRAVNVNGVPTPMFGVASVAGQMQPVVLSGRAPRHPGEIAFAPTTLRALGVEIGDRVSVGDTPGRIARVVGTALLPETSHTAYDQSGWMTGAAVDDILVAEPPVGPEDVWDFALVRWAPGAQAKGEARLRELAGDIGFVQAAEVPSSVGDLRQMRVLPFSLAVFFALLAVATVAHALVTTVRRRRHDLAIMRSFGLTSRQSRVAIAWQATLIAVAGVVIGLPLGIIAGRAVWRSLASSFPMVYVPPLALVVVVLVVPAAVLVVNAIAVGPGRSAARIRPADALRVE